MVRVRRLGVVAFAIAPLVFGVSSSAASARLAPSGNPHVSAAATSPRGAVPFRGAFRVTATWGATTGYTHATPAVDFALPIGTPVYAANNGFVDFTSRDPRNCNPLQHGATYALGIKWCMDHGLDGTRIRIHGDDGTFTMYVHLSAIRTGISASPASRVKVGQLIGWSGNSGISTGPHLHFSRINVAGTATIDPGILRACWSATAHNYSNLKSLRGTTVRNDGYTC